ncbi:O-antigen/teichoic acid export membrane protein [Agrobacterium vitis]|nr:O-antigen/teichoic acid export membrane protein [Agrobacterium vitis]MBE1439274.1 O-antigen/teichoic acid export membrane protein [Agrobacterium vitis]
MKICWPFRRKPLSDSDDIVFAHLTENRSRAAVHGAFWSVLDTLIPNLLNSAVFIITSRYLLPHDFGLVALALSVVSFVGSVGPTAFGEALIQQKTIRKSHLDTVFWLCLLSAAALYSVLALAAPFMSSELGHESIAGLIMVVGLRIFFDLSGVVPNALIGRTMSFRLAAIRTAIATLVSGTLCISLILSGFGLWSLAIAQVAAPMASCLASFWGAGWVPGFRIKLSSLKELLHYGVFASANRFLQAMSIDQLVIGALISPAALGVYNFARRLFDMLNGIVAGGLSPVSHVLLSSLQHDRSKVRDAFLMATFGCSLVSFPAFMGLAAVADDAIPVVFGDHWTAAIWPVRFFCVIGLMSGIGTIQASLITSQGKSNWWFYYQLLRNIITILTVFLLYPYGITTIAMGLMIGTLCLWPITLWMVTRIINMSVAVYFGQFLRPAAAYCVMLVAVLGCGHQLQDWPAVARLLIEIGVGAVVYLGVVSLLCRERLIFLVQTILRRRQAA